MPCKHSNILKGRPATTATVKRSKIEADPRNDTNKKNIKATSKLTILPFDIPEIEKIRANIKEVTLWSNATGIRRLEDIGYMCCFCQEHYPNPADLKKHTLETHRDVEKAFYMKLTFYRLVVRLDITGLQCKICNLKLDTINQLLEHLKDDHNKTIYTDIKHHIIPLKFNTERLQCCLCSRTFNKYKMLIEHMSVHYRNYICKICDAAFVNIAKLTNHTHVHRLGTFKCDYCTSVFDTKVKKVSHEKIVHLQKALNKCGYCDESFTSYRQKERHLMTEHGVEMPTLNCDACDKVYKSRYALREHINRDHLMERKHKCAECEMTFYKKSSLRDHMVKHTKVQSYQCLVCSKAFGRRYTLNEHMKTHDNDKRFKCEHCEQAFMQKCSWKVHMKLKHSEIV